MYHNLWFTSQHFKTVKIKQEGEQLHFQQNEMAKVHSAPQRQRKSGTEGAKEQIEINERKSNKNFNDKRHKTGENSKHETWNMKNSKIKGVH